MPRASCRPDPVELLLRSVLQRSLLLAGTAALTSCSTALDVDELDPGGPASQDAQAADGASSPSKQPVSDAGPEPTAADAGRLDARPGWDVSADASPPAAADASADAVVPGQLGTLGPALPCAEGTYFPVQASGLKPAQSYDYVALRRRGGFPSPEAGMQGDAWTASDFQVLSETGVKCATAPTNACADKVASHPLGFISTTCSMICREDSVVTTQGAEVNRWTGRDQLLSLLSPIDSADEALLLVNDADYNLTCNNAEATSWRAVSGGFEVYATRVGSMCNPVETRYHLHVSTTGDITVLGSVVLRQLQGCAGRKPAGLRSDSRVVGRNALGDFLARIAHLEAASVVAFERLARELRAHGAPLGLLRGALEARGDEVRHAHQIAQLALARGGELTALEVSDLPVRELEEIALENAVEGCVRETFGALVGAYQAQHARDDELRRAMLEIAADEARHAALSHRVQHWLEPRLSPEERERVRHARERAVFQLAQEIAVAEDAELCRAAGLPSPEMAHILLEELTKTLWRSPFKGRGHLALA